MDRDMLDSLPPGVLLARDAAAAGTGCHALRRAVRAGALVRVRPGAYVRRAEWDVAQAEARHLMVVEAASRQLADPEFSHESAAAVWGLPLVGDGLGDAVHVLGPATEDGARRGLGTRAGVTRHAARPSVRVVEHAGIHVTSPADTVLAIAGARDLRRSLPVADAAVRAGLVTADELRAAARGRVGTRDVRRLRAVALLANGRSESAGESLSRARMHLDGFVQPDLQVPFVHRGVLVARVDFWWADARVVGEFDGRKKYRVDGVGDRRALEERVWAEKRREDRLRHAGFRVVRWTWQDAWQPGPLAALLRGAGVPRA
ncbi:type IV toxin-antitoxin system AbiEi family antitoxin domain-containing protein [Cellulomonas sp. Y8]|uniref:type IV toxin-antitoxin system AbiEi family antitoxin domain-containing protein n=1 Tax=Cellulomonas sp. Y8 TaxID=2591145 RepID=UPI003D72F52D